MKMRWVTEINDIVYEHDDIMENIADLEYLNVVGTIVGNTMNALEEINDARLNGSREEKALEIALNDYASKVGELMLKSRLTLYEKVGIKVRDA
jgi:hypothetical protein